MDKSVNGVPLVTAANGDAAITPRHIIIAGKREDEAFIVTITLDAG